MENLIQDLDLDFSLNLECQPCPMGVLSSRGKRGREITQ